MAGTKWTDKEKEILFLNYKGGSKLELIELLPKRSWDSIKLMAKRLGLSFFKPDHNFSSADLSSLLHEKPEAYYWMGFLTADGSFVGNRMALTLAVKDQHHVERFAKFIKCNTHAPCIKRSYGLKVQDRVLVPKIKDKFHLKQNKTIHPPIITNWMRDDDLFISYLLGYIDGDGSICKQTGRDDAFLRIKCHKSWLHFLQNLSERLFSILSLNAKDAKIIKQGENRYAHLTIARACVLQYLRDKALELNLPVLTRKWNRVQRRKDHVELQ